MSDGILIMGGLLLMVLVKKYGGGDVKDGSKQTRKERACGVSMIDTH